MSKSVYRHVVKPNEGTVRQLKKEVVIYSTMMDGAPSGESDATYVVYGISPMWQFAGDADNSICMEANIPDDRVPYTPITLEAEYFMAGIGGVRIVTALRYGIFGRGEAPPSLGTESWAYFVKIPPAAPRTDLIGPLSIPESKMDGREKPINMQVVVTRLATHPLDVDPNAMYLVKVIMRYTAYV